MTISIQWKEIDKFCNESIKRFGLYSAEYIFVRLFQKNDFVFVFLSLRFTGINSMLLPGYNYGIKSLLYRYNAKIMVWLIRLKWTLLTTVSGAVSEMIKWSDCFEIFSDNIFVVCFSPAGMLKRTNQVYRWCENKADWGGFS